MIKQAPSLPRILLMVAFALSCFGIVLFLWVSFGGPIPLRGKAYEVRVAFPEAATLADNADVRISGVTIGHVHGLKLDLRDHRTLATLDIDRPYAPLPADTRAVLRQKTLLGETYVELSPGNASGPKLRDGALLPLGQVKPTVELDEILRIFGPGTRRQFRAFVKDEALQIRGRSQDLNDALGNLPPFAHSGADLLSVLDVQSRALSRLVRNSGIALGALNEHRNAVQGLVSSADRLFSVTAQQQAALASTFEIFPTFLDESRATLARLARFSTTTDPVVNELKPVADDLGPTVIDIGALSPDLERLFKRLPPLISASRRGLPAAARFVRGAGPVLAGLHTFLPELNPILSYLNFYQETVSMFLTNGGAAINYRLPSPPGSVPLYTLPQFGVTNGKSLSLNETRPPYERGNAYPAPNAYRRALSFGTTEAFDCSNSETGGVKRDPTTGGSNPSPPCFPQPPSLFQDQQFPRLERGRAPLVPPPHGREGTQPATVQPRP